YLNSKVPSRGSTGWVAPLADSQRELVPARVHHPDSTVRLAHRVGTQADQPLGLRAPIRHHEVEPLAPAAVVGRTGADVPGDLRAAGRRLDSRLDAPIPHERPAEDVPPEVARFAGSFAGDFAEVAGSVKEIGVLLDDADLVAAGVGHHDAALRRVLADQPSTQLHRLGDGTALIVEVRAGQMQ